jgi:1-deoxy-D-xylulose-5-phosphate reductoisomerase
MAKKRIILLGATGSIGRQALEVVREFPDRFDLVGLASNRDASGLRAAASAFPGAGLALSGIPAGEAPAGMPSGCLFGPSAILDLLGSVPADLVINGIAGSAGLAPSLAALERGMDLALANKESVVMGYGLLEVAAVKAGRSIIPVDSEHAALFHLLRGYPDAVELYITASGGAFRDRPLESLSSARPDEAAAHPSWSMGRKISIDSATMANKGLEVIEASRLFHMPADRVKVLVHPQSMAHALIRTRDGALVVNVSAPDMRLPILNALAYPETLPSSFGSLDLAGLSLEFKAPDPERYPLLGLAYAALAAGEGATVAYNAADEVAVAAFESGAIGYCDIAPIVETCLGRGWPTKLPSLEGIFSTDTEARACAQAAVKEIGTR